jgi:hypothetical protein
VILGNSTPHHARGKLLVCDDAAGPCTDPEANLLLPFDARCSHTKGDQILRKTETDVLGLKRRV